jgi:hypothetical protein
VRGIEQPEILSVLKRSGEEKYIQGMGKVLQRIVHVCGRFGIFTNNNMIELAAGIVLKNSTYNKGRGTSMQVLTKNLLGVGNSEPVRQLKKAGVIFISVKQHLQIHQRRKDTEKATRQQGIKAAKWDSAKTSNLRQ